MTSIWKRVSRTLAVAAFGLVASTGLAHGAYPDHSIRLIVPTGAGGITDLLARVVGQHLGILLKQPVVVENKAGASGVIGSQFVAQASPDGYTLLFAFPTHVANPSTIKSLPYDTAAAFAPIGRVGQVAEILLVNKDSDIQNFGDLLKKARASHNRLNYGSVGAGSQGDICTLVFESQAGIKMEPVPYKSEPEMLTALMRNDVQVAFTSVPAALPQIRSGKVRALAVSSAERLALLPDLPTVAEAGLKGYDVTGWNGLFAPKGTPGPVIEMLNRALNQALKDTKVVEQFQSLGVPVLGGAPEQLQQAVVHDISMIRQTLGAVGYTPQ
jgi:tripartite-type tricarboxylate transporter receptor subunit TctC